MKTVAFVIPGFKHTPDRKIYKDVICKFNKKGIKTIPVKITWKYKALSDWLKEFLTIYDKDKADNNIIFGFSYGTMIAFLASTKVKANTIILCSLSPYFYEDLPFLFKSWKKSVGKKRMKDFKTYKMSDIVSKVKTKIYILYGDHEGKFIEKRANDTFKKIKTDKQLIKVKDAKHDIGNPQYFKEIKKVIEKL